jgi:hypothetical protein
MCFLILWKVYTLQVTYVFITHLIFIIYEYIIVRKKYCINTIVGMSNKLEV